MAEARELPAPVAFPAPFQGNDLNTSGLRRSDHEALAFKGLAVLVAVRQVTDVSRPDETISPWQREASDR